MGEEGAELVPPAAGAAFIHVMADIVGQAGEHAFPVLGVEGFIVAMDQRFGIVHLGSPGLPA